jgi:hypothetical protein
MPSVEPWLRGTHTEVPAVARAVLHALDLALEDLNKWTAGVTDAEAHAQPHGLPSIAFHLKHIARSVDRILTYAEGNSLSGEQLTALKSEKDGEESLAALLAEVEASFRNADRRVRTLATADLDCGGPGCSDSFRRFLSESSVLGWATGVSGGRLMLTGAALVPCPSFD